MVLQYLKCPFKGLDYTWTWILLLLRKQADNAGFFVFLFSLSFFLCVKQTTRNFPNCLVIRQSSPWLLLGKVLWVSSLTDIYRHAFFLHIEFLPSQHKQTFFGSGHDVLFQNDFTESRIYLDVFTFSRVKISSSWDEKHVSQDKPSISRKELLSFEQYCSLT